MSLTSRDGESIVNAFACRQPSSTAVPDPGAVSGGPYSTIPWRRWAMAAAGALVLAACEGAEPVPEPTAAPPAAAPARVEPLVGRPLTVELAGKGVATHPLELAAGTFVRLTVDQLDVDVQAEIFDPNGAARVRFDNLFGRARPEEVVWIAEQAGGHELRVTSFAAAAGRYRLLLEERRPATELDRRRQVAELLFSDGERLRREGGAERRRRAAAKLLLAIDLWRELGDRRRQAAGLFHLGMAYRAEERRLAIAAFEQALERFDPAAEAHEAAATLHHLGHLHYQLGDLARSIERYLEALPLRRAAGNRNGEASTYNNLGRSYEMRGDFPEALECYRTALQLWRELGAPKSQSLALHNLGKSYLSLGLADEALDSLAQAMSIRERLGDPADQVSTLSAIGQAHNRRGELDQALAAFQRALELSREAGDRQGEAVALNSVALASHGIGRSQEAVADLEEALAIFRQLSDRSNEAITLHSLGWVLAGSGEPRRAADHYARALLAFDSIQHRHGRITTLRSMALVERRLGDLDRARAHVEAALAEIEDIRSKPHDHTLRYSYFSTKQDFYETYVDVLMDFHRRQPDAGYDGEALTASERARARSQLDALRESGADLRGGADPQLHARERELEERIESLEIQRLRWSDDGAGAARLAGLERELRELFLEYGRLQGQIRRADPRYAALTQPRPLAAAAIQRRVVDRDTVLLEYDLGKERSYLWAVTPDAVHSFELPPRTEIESTAERAYKLLSSSHQTATRVPTALALGKLSRQLLTPAAGLLAGKRLLVVSDGSLQYIPFAVLPEPGAAGDADGAGDAPPLGAAHEIVSVPSASTLDVLRRQLAGRRPPARMLSVLADPVFGTEDPRFGEEGSAGPPASGVRGMSEPEPRTYERLAFSRFEAEAILALAPAGTSFAAIGFEATREAVTSGALADYRFVHFATHGELNTARPELSRLVLSQVDRQGRRLDGYVFAHEIYNLELAADLVVLSACETALGTEIRGEGLLGLTQGFLYAGAASVLVSLWNVDDRATAELMTHFYRGLLQDDLPPAAALRAAQTAIRQTRRWQAPYYWAGFVLQGDWRRPRG